MSHVIKVDVEENRSAGLQKAADVVTAGGVVAFPTESFYGLAVDTKNDKAIGRLYEIKNRRNDQPILILTPSVDILPSWVLHIPDISRRLMETFWPGGLTMLFDARPTVSPLLTAGTGKIGIRLSNHNLATGLAGLVGAPITGTSANISNQPPCNSAEQVLSDIGHSVDLILDAGRTAGGQGSTILDVTVDPPIVLREGMVTREQLKAYI